MSEVEARDARFEEVLPFSPYRRKPMIVGAVRNETGERMIPSPAGPIATAPGWWIVRTAQGNYSSVAPELFEAVYEPVTLMELAIEERDRRARADLVAHLQKIADVLAAAHTFHRLRDEMHAALHLTDERVRYSRLTSELAGALDRLNGILARGQG